VVSRKWTVRWAVIALALMIVGPLATTASSQPVRSRAHDSGLLMLSTQFTPVTEAEKFRSILSGAPTAVNFLPGDSGALTDRLRAEEKAGHVTISIFAGLHGDFPPLVSEGLLQDVSPLLKQLVKRGFPKSIVKLSTMGSKTKHYYIPWMQATYVMAVNKKALKYLPKGAKVGALTYDQLIQWGKNMKKGHGQPMIGLPAGTTGLIHRFIQGYLYPSFAHSSGVAEGQGSLGGDQPAVGQLRIHARATPLRRGVGCLGSRRTPYRCCDEEAQGLRAGSRACRPERTRLYGSHWRASDPEGCTESEGGAESYYLPHAAIGTDRRARESRLLSCNECEDSQEPSGRHSS
jgi:hypothetical protein